MLDMGALGATKPSITLISISNSTVSRVPFKIPALDYTKTQLQGIAINRSGLAVVGESSIFAADRYSRLAETNRGRFRSIPLPTSTPGTGSGYYLISTSKAPIPLELPSGMLAIFVIGMNDNGFTVGEVAFGDASNPTYVPYYWNAQGNAFALQLPNGVTEGRAVDINNFGAIVGLVYNTASYGVIWGAPDATPTNINSMLPATFSYFVQGVASIGNDDTLAVYGYPKSSPSGYVLFGLNPK
jgi:hypothetical protein